MSDRVSSLETMDTGQKKVEPIEEIENAEAQDAEFHAEAIVSEVPKRKWSSYIWDTFDKSPEERRLVLKLDLALLTFGSLGKNIGLLFNLHFPATDRYPGYFIKYLDQANINNAFVSGM